MRTAYASYGISIPAAGLLIPKSVSNIKVGFGIYALIRLKYGQPVGQQSCIWRFLSYLSEPLPTLYLKNPQSKNHLPFLDTVTGIARS